MTCNSISSAFIRPLCFSLIVLNAYAMDYFSIMAKSIFPAHPAIIWCWVVVRKVGVYDPPGAALSFPGSLEGTGAGDKVQLRSTQILWWVKSALLVFLYPTEHVVYVKNGSALPKSGLADKFPTPPTTASAFLLESRWKRAPLFCWGPFFHRLSCPSNPPSDSAQPAMGGPQPSSIHRWLVASIHRWFIFFHPFRLWMASLFCLFVASSVFGHTGLRCLAHIAAQGFFDLNQSIRRTLETPISRCMFLDQSSNQKYKRRWRW